MSSDLAPRSSAAPVPTNDDNRYKAVQSKLNKFGKALDIAILELESLSGSMQANAARTDDVATDIENAGLDPKFVALTSNVAVALTGAARHVRKLTQIAQETVDLTHQTRHTHAKLYRGLDDVRSNRSEKTPKPGFFNR
ncbi:conjugal transfer protein TraB [Streptomyces palmae]|uniref:Conjugal transfer protein TraB n=1 Tax=Streptomyces palmae TaxID=1701085 RepID=A0A4Z0FKL5_9ACTN|nr:conjugal transfer protein TraB [Streptomyces palmae]TGA83232.1 conjugal transfer protein TraB [Streptomyces palmae]